MCQRRYANVILKKFVISKSKPVKSLVVPSIKMNKDIEGAIVDDTYFKQIVGSLMYLTTTTPYIMFNVSLISSYMLRPTKLHLQAAKEY